jgi:hypothetical protein
MKSRDGKAPLLNDHSERYAHSTQSIAHRREARSAELPGERREHTGAQIASKHGEERSAPESPTLPASEHATLCSRQTSAQRCATLRKAHKNAPSAPRGPHHTEIPQKPDTRDRTSPRPHRIEAAHTAAAQHVHRAARCFAPFAPVPPKHRIHTREGRGPGHVLVRRVWQPTA